MGAGKTAVLGEASDILALRQIAHAAIDLDGLGLGLLPAAAKGDGVMYRNLQAVCNNYASLGIKRLLLARAMEDRAELELCRGIVSATKTVVCRVTGPHPGFALAGRNLREVEARKDRLLQMAALVWLGLLGIILAGTFLFGWLTRTPKPVIA